jgi:hypothetical protein
VNITNKSAKVAHQDKKLYDTSQIKRNKHLTVLRPQKEAPWMVEMTTPNIPSFLPTACCLPLHPKVPAASKGYNIVITTNIPVQQQLDLWFSECGPKTHSSPQDYFCFPIINLKEKNIY